MAKLIMCQGLPGSGKSTWAVEQMAENLNATRVNKDDIRAGLEKHGWVWSKENEKDVIRIRDERIRAAFDHKYEVVISDDTNLHRKHELALRAIARECAADFEVKIFDTPVEECIRRDSLRVGKARVGEKVIRGMAKLLNSDGVVPVFAPYDPPHSTMKAIMCDLDGTLCLFKGKRSPFDASTCDQDDLNRPIRRLLDVYSRHMGYQIIYMSGREDTYRPQTEIFFRKHQLPPGPLYMRKAGDMRKDWIVKGELFDEYVRNKYCVEFVLDDRNQVVDFWRSIGLTCWQVADGNF